MRKQIALPDSLQKIKHQSPKDIITQIRHYELITPLYGGGVEANKNDPITLIRGSEIRGQLRFWWRATRGCLTEQELAEFKNKHKDKYKDKDVDTETLRLDALREREGEVWGEAHDFRKEEEKTKENETTENEKEIDRYKYTVQIYTEVKDEGGSKKPFKLEKKNRGKGYDQKSNNNVDVPEYAAFPLQIPREELDDLADLSQAEAEKHLREVRIGVTFKLEISYPKEFEKEIKAALWAWETFGGIGARTRRGFGALKCTSVKHAGPVENADSKEPTSLQPANTASAKAWIQEQASEHIKENGTWPKDVPHLSRKFIENQNIKIVTTSKGTWKNLITTLQKFRQSPPNDINTSESKTWPELEVIKRLTLPQPDSYNLPELDHLHNIFPRAALGLPIIFNLKERKQDERQIILQPQESGRFASPLILKPISCLDGTSIGLAIILQGVEPEKMPLELKEVIKDGKKGKKLQSGDEEYNLNILKQKINESAKGQSSNTETDIRQAFLRYLK